MFVSKNFISCVCEGPINPQVLLRCSAQTNLRMNVAELKKYDLALKVRQSRKQIMLSRILPKNERWISTSKITTSRLVQKRVYLLAKRT